MPALITITINSVDFYVSTEDVALTNLWKSYVSACSVRYAMDYLYGGYIRPQFGGIEFLPSLFIDDWPPPKECHLKVEYTDSTEVAAVILFEGTAFRASIAQDAVAYDLYGGKYNDLLTDQTFTDTLINEFTTYCGASHLNLTLDTTAAQVVSPTVTYTATGERKTEDVLSEIAAYWGHCFYIEDGTLYLIHILQNNGTGTVDEFDFMPVTYASNPAYSLYKSTLSDVEYHVDGTYTYGHEFVLAPVCAAAGVIPTALANLKLIMELEKIQLTMPITAANIPEPGKQLTWTDTSTQNDTTVWMRVRNRVYDFVQDEVVIEGDGGVS